MEKGEFVAVRRETSAKMVLKIDAAVDSVTRLLDDIHDNMYRKYVVVVSLSFSPFSVVPFYKAETNLQRWVHSFLVPWWDFKHSRESPIYT